VGQTPGFLRLTRCLLAVVYTRYKNHDTISYETALERAADTVLLKYGLLSLPVGAAAK
jgi:hypothetical protein